jgi:hypothetical protein
MYSRNDIIALALLVAVCGATACRGGAQTGHEGSSTKGTDMTSGTKPTETHPQPQGTPIEEGSVGTLSGHRVAVWTVMFADGKGEDPTLELQLSIDAPGSTASKQTTVRLGDRVQLGTDSYRVTELRRKSGATRGRIVLAPDQGGKP